MSTPSRPGRLGGGRWPLVAVGAVLATAGAGVLGASLSGAAPSAPPRTSVATSAEPQPGAAGEAALPSAVPSSDASALPADGPAAVPVPAAPAVDLGPVLPAAAPVALRIPSIGVDAGELVPLALDAQGVLPAPERYDLPGWYTGGPHPGGLGPSVIAGHVDGPDGPAVFYRLGELEPGAVVEVPRDDGTVATFVVDAVERYAKADFPTSRVYGNTTDRAELRLITCGGAFDRTTGHYVDNIVVFAHLV
ncbi:class F sortase [Cellulomonas endophytica]|uniref:class F sortase n=1 Tax=Cellulomonas endophytica TaxID=2494735 RepID=UPI00196AA4A5|nr:class F sortase [Cellulomonas endophytica]